MQAMKAFCRKLSSFLSNSEFSDELKQFWALRDYILEYFELRIIFLQTASSFISNGSFASWLWERLRTKGKLVALRDIWFRYYKCQNDGKEISELELKNLLFFLRSSKDDRFVDPELLKFWTQTSEGKIIQSLCSALDKLLVNIQCLIEENTKEMKRLVNIEDYSELQNEFKKSKALLQIDIYENQIKRMLAQYGWDEIAEMKKYIEDRPRMIAPKLLKMRIEEIEKQKQASIKNSSDVNTEKGKMEKNKGVGLMESEENKIKAIVKNAGSHFHKKTD